MTITSRTPTMNTTPLTDAQIRQLTDQFCTADDWKAVQVASEDDLTRIRGVHFGGTVHIGPTSGSILYGGLSLPCGLYNVLLVDCTIGARVRIANVRTGIARYRIGDDVLIQDVGQLVAEEEATFGNGLELDVVNEGGGRGTMIFNRLTAQVAYLKGMLRHNTAFTHQLRKLATAEVAATVPEEGTIGPGARIVGCGTVRNVVVGPSARLEGVAHLENGTVNSCQEHPTLIGTGVQAREFVVAEGARIDSGAVLENVFVGQGVKMGKQFSAENSIFFANCEAFHGEAVSVLAGPHTVTHHKSTLLIAGLFSFYNAGSGTNQSNHMYKLGPVHQGIFERGCKTGSFSYVLYESHVGAFSVVIGKHLANVRTPNLPFSNIHEKGGESFIVPGMNLFSVGTVRDGEKWPKRDTRKGPDRRDLIIFDVFSPYTVEKMRRGRDELLALNESTSKERLVIPVGGIQMQRVFLRKGAKFYSSAITRYVNGKIIERLLPALARAESWASAISSLAPARTLTRPSEWTDLCGLLVPVECVRELEAAVEAGTVTSYEQLLQRLRGLFDRYREFEWQYVVATYAKESGNVLPTLTKEQAVALVDEWQKAALSIQSSVLDDAKKEFGPAARVGYGLDLPESIMEADFKAVRGTLEGNAVVQTMTQESESILRQGEQAKGLIASAR